HPPRVHWCGPPARSGGAWPLGTSRLPFPALLQALLSLLLIALIVLHTGQSRERVGILRGLGQHPFIERSGLAQLALVSQHRRQPRHSREVVGGMAQD